MEKPWWTSRYWVVRLLESVPGIRGVGWLVYRILPCIVGNCYNTAAGCWIPNLIIKLLQWVNKKGTQWKRMGWDSTERWRLLRHASRYTTWVAQMKSRWEKGRLCVAGLEGMNEVPSPKTNIAISNRRCIFKWLVFYCHVSFPGEIYGVVVRPDISSYIYSFPCLFPTISFILQ